MRYALLVGLLSLLPGAALAHCQIPCGIFDDHARIHEIREHITTIDKSLTKMAEVHEKNDLKSQNQMVRWVMNKDAHAEKIMRIISDYFLAQKIKAGSKEYLPMLKAHHAVMTAAMKCKQSGDRSCIAPLTSAVDGIEKFWPKK